METISGLTNWKLTIRRENDGVAILRAVSCDRNAVLPEELFGLPVTALGDRALAVGAKSVEGERLRILGGAESGDWDNRNITELSLPPALRRIGDYAFLNLRAMETLRFCDTLQSVGGACFMNCACFSRLELSGGRARRSPALASIVGSLTRELDVEIREADGSILRLIFPEYREDFFENSPAHHFQFTILGGGYAYRHVFRDKLLSLADYDALWPRYLAQEHDEDSALRLAYCRLRYPGGLSEEARARYAAYLREQIGGALSHALHEKDMQGLGLLLRLGHPDPETLDAALRESRALRLTEATALLLEQRRARPAAGRARSFEL